MRNGEFMALARNDAKSALHGAAWVCTEILDYAKTPQAVKIGFLDGFQKNNVLSFFLYAIACDLFATVTAEDYFVQRAQVAYTEALIEYQNQTKRNAFLQLQIYYKKISLQMNDGFKSSLYKLLERINYAQYGQAPMPPLDEIQKSLQGLNDNLHLFEGKQLEYAINLLTKASAINFSALSLTDINNLPKEVWDLIFASTHLYFSIGMSNVDQEDRFSEVHQLTDSLSKLTVNNENESFDLPSQKLRLLRHFIESTDVPNFIKKLRDSLPKLNPKQNLKRAPLQTDDQTDLNETDMTDMFERRILTAKRSMEHMEVTRDPAPTEQKEALDESVIAPSEAKRLKL